MIALIKKLLGKDNHIPPADILTEDEIERWRGILRTWKEKYADLQRHDRTLRQEKRYADLAALQPLIKEAKAYVDHYTYVLADYPPSTPAAQ